jgi:hypothetical protein
MWESRDVRRAALALIAVAASGACSARQLSRMDRWHGGGRLAHDLAYRRALDDAPIHGVTVGSIVARGFASPSRAGWAFGVDVAAGGSHPRGFAWRAAISPVGLGTRLGSHGVVGIIGGVGGSGITGRVAAAAELPAEAFLTLRVGSRAAVSLWVQPAWLKSESALRAGLTVRIGRAYHQWGFDAGNGYHVGVVASDELGARFVGATIGYDLDIATE